MIYKVFNVKTLEENWYTDIKTNKYIYLAVKELKFNQLKGKKKTQDNFSGKGLTITPLNEKGELPKKGDKQQSYKT